MTVLNSDLTELGRRLKSDPHNPLLERELRALGLRLAVQAVAGAVGSAFHGLAARLQAASQPRASRRLWR